MLTCTRAASCLWVPLHTQHAGLWRLIACWLAHAACTTDECLGVSAGFACSCKPQAELLMLLNAPKLLV